MLNLEKSYRESDRLARQSTSHGNCSGSKLYMYIARRVMRTPTYSAMTLCDMDCLTWEKLTARGTFTSQNIVRDRRRTRQLQMASN